MRVREGRDAHHGEMLTKEERRMLDENFCTMTSRTRARGGEETWAPFNLGCVVVWLSLYAVDCISRRSWPSLGRNQGSGAEMQPPGREATQACGVDGVERTT